MAARAGAQQQRQNASLAAELARSEDRTLRRQAHRHASEPQDVDDILQRAFELFIERYAPPYEPMAWLMTTIKREAWGLARRSRRNPEIPIKSQTEPGGPGYDLGECLPSASPGPAEVVTERAEHRRLRDEIRGLKPDERTALGLLGLGYSYAEIAELHGWTLTQVNRCVSEGRARIRERLASAPD